MFCGEDGSPLRPRSVPPELRRRSAELGLPRALTCTPQTISGPVVADEPAGRTVVTTGSETDGGIQPPRGHAADTPPDR